MYKPKSVIQALILCVLLSRCTQAEDLDDLDGEKERAITIALTELDVNDQTLELRYQLRNGSEHDVWICEDIAVFQNEFDFEAYLAEDNQTLQISRKLNVPGYMESYVPRIGRYVRLRAYKERTESLSFTLPVNPRRVYSARRARATEYARRLELEIGFYTGDLTGKVHAILEKVENINNENADTNLILIKRGITGFLQFNELNEYARYRDEEVNIPYTWQALKGERILRIAIDGVRIPYSEKPEFPKLLPPDLDRCTRIEIQYQPSMLEYFFPYTGQKSLMSPDEKQYLRSLKTTVVTDPEYLKTLAHDVGEGMDGGFITERSTAHVICYHDDERLTSFSVYDNSSIETEGKQRFRYRKGLQSIRALTPQIQPFELRLKCAANLKDLWYRFRFYHKAEKKRLKDSTGKTETVYPASTKWCDLMVRAYRTIGMLDKNIMRPHMCPSVGQGRCHYAMNPNCEYDSPQDMVFLFETKAGWNQHGGPELFTFDNHNPRGGCVLLNDGTVKFIRTKEELQQLRWK